VVGGIGNAERSAGEWGACWKVSMRIEFERFGGLEPRLMNRLPRWSGELSADEERLVRPWIGTDFYSLASSPPPRHGGGAFRYDITVSDGERTHRVVLAEEAVPPSLRPLIDWLERKAGYRSD
jgi:hypothetical protein